MIREDMRLRDIMLALVERFAKANGYIEVETCSEFRTRYIKPTWEDDAIIDVIPKIELESTSITSRISYDSIGSTFFIEYNEYGELIAIFAYGEVAYKIAVAMKDEVELNINN